MYIFLWLLSRGYDTKVRFKAPILRTEEETRAFLRKQLENDFCLVEEVHVRHALFRKRRLRIDLLAIPKDSVMNDIAIGFETKCDKDWDMPSFATTLKQSSDYVLASVEPDLKEHAGKRVMAVFVYPSPITKILEDTSLSEPPGSKMNIFRGMAHMASYHRVGRCGIVNGKFSLCCPGEVWISGKGWRATARNILVGKRQVGSQRFNILDELEVL